MSGLWNLRVKRLATATLLAAVAGSISGRCMELRALVICNNSSESLLLDPSGLQLKVTPHPTVKVPNGSTCIANGNVVDLKVGGKPDLVSWSFSAGEMRAQTAGKVIALEYPRHEAAYGVAA